MFGCVRKQLNRLINVFKYDLKILHISNNSSSQLQILIWVIFNKRVTCKMGNIWLINVAQLSLHISINFQIISG